MKSFSIIIVALESDSDIRVLILILCWTYIVNSLLGNWKFCQYWIFSVQQSILEQLYNRYLDMIHIQGVPEKIVHKKTKGHRVKPALGAYSTRNSKMFSLWALLETISFSRWKWPLKFEKIGSHISTQKLSRMIIQSMLYSTLKIMNISLWASLCLCLFRWWKS